MKKASRENRPAVFSGGEKKTSRQHHPNTFLERKGKIAQMPGEKNRQGMNFFKCWWCRCFYSKYEKATKRTIHAKGSCYFEIPNIQQITRFWSQPKCILFHQTNIQMVDTRRFLSTGNLSRLWCKSGAWTFTSICQLNAFVHLGTNL